MFIAKEYLIVALKNEEESLSAKINCERVFDETPEKQAGLTLSLTLAAERHFSLLILQNSNLHTNRKKLSSLPVGINSCNAKTGKNNRGDQLWFC